MLKCVVLVGFSTTGKSTICKRFSDRYSDVIETADSDQFVSADDGGHIYNVFLRLFNGWNSREGMKFIESREREFLRTIGPSTKPMLIASGPFLPLRNPEWGQFRNRVSPVFVYLEKSPEGVLDGLLRRRSVHLEDKKLSSSPGFGCWDDGVTTELSDGEWIEIPRDQALKNVNGLMSMVVPRYESVASHKFTWPEYQTPEGQIRLDAEIQQELGI